VKELKDLGMGVAVRKRVLEQVEIDREFFAGL
jgi:hypothetical protein